MYFFYLYTIKDYVYARNTCLGVERVCRLEWRVQVVPEYFQYAYKDPAG